MPMLPSSVMNRWINRYRMHQMRTATKSQTSITLVAVFGADGALAGESEGGFRGGGFDGRHGMGHLEDNLHDLAAAAPFGAIGMDGDGDVNLSPEEFAALWNEASRRTAVRAFQLFDINGDATLGTLEWPAMPVSGGRFAGSTKANSQAYDATGQFGGSNQTGVVGHATGPNFQSAFLRGQEVTPLVRCLPSTDPAQARRRRTRAGRHLRQHDRDANASRRWRLPSDAVKESSNGVDSFASTLLEPRVQLPMHSALPATRWPDPIVQRAAATHRIIHGAPEVGDFIVEPNPPPPGVFMTNTSLART